MINEVWFLCPALQGETFLVSPVDLPENSFSPSIFAVNYTGLENSYVFKAVQNGEVIATECIQNPVIPNIFSVKVERIGVFLFKLIPIDIIGGESIKYAGKSQALQGEGFNMALVPDNESFFELSCREYDFYFVGNNGFE